MNWMVAFKLGRVSNLPTVWTNVWAAVVLAGGSLPILQMVWLLVAFSLFYVGGMYLNDAFDADIDAKERPERPIPSGQVSRRLVYGAGYGMLLGGVLMLAGAGLLTDRGLGMWPALGGLGLAGAIVLYDWTHKKSPISPALMGICRALVYIAAGLCVAVPLPVPLLVGAGLLLCYLVGLTYVAKHENLGRIANLWPVAFLAAPVVYGVGLVVDRPESAPFLVLLVVWILVSLYFLVRRRAGDIPRAVVSLIAGIALLDAMLVAGSGEIQLALWAIAGFLLTLALQRYVPGT